MSILEVSNVSKSFGGVKANVDISMKVEKGKIVGLIGPNGSGCQSSYITVKGNTTQTTKGFHEVIRRTYFKYVIL